MQRELQSVEENANEQRYSYSILHGPLPVAGYQATIKVTEDEGHGGCAVEWSSEFDPTSGAGESDAVEAISGAYKA